MGTVRWPRVFLGGLVFFLVATAGEIVWSLAASSQLETPMAGDQGAMQTGAMAAHILWNLVVGVLAVWLYAAIRPRYGPGVRTALRAGVAVWIFVHATFALAASTLGFLSPELMAWSAAWGLVETLAATVAGAWVYREP
jgi:hypothetical protein